MRRGENERKLILQLFGKDPAVVAEAARRICGLGIYDGIDLNMGCPARKVACSGEGSGLMKDPVTAERMMKDRALARRVIDEAKAKNPDSLEIAWTEARFVYQGGKGDVAAATRLLEEARRMGKRKCGGRLSELAPHEAEAFCNILGYLSKILYDRGERGQIRPLLDEARATGADTPVVCEIEARLP